MGYIWIVKKLKRCYVWFGTYKKGFVLCDPELINLIPVEGRVEEGHTMPDIYDEEYLHQQPQPIHKIHKQQQNHQV